MRLTWVFESTLHAIIGESLATILYDALAAVTGFYCDSLKTKHCISVSAQRVKRPFDDTLLTNCTTASLC